MTVLYSSCASDKDEACTNCTSTVLLLQIPSGWPELVSLKYIFSVHIQKSSMNQKRKGSFPLRTAWQKARLSYGFDHMSFCTITPEIVEEFLIIFTLQSSFKS